MSALAVYVGAVIVLVALGCFAVGRAWGRIEERLRLERRLATGPMRKRTGYAWPVAGAASVKTIAYGSGAPPPLLRTPDGIPDGWHVWIDEHGTPVLEPHRCGPAIELLDEL